VKLAPVSRAMATFHAAAGDPIKDTIVHTGQHYDHALSRIFFDELEIPRPDINLNVGSGSHGAQTASMLTAIEDVLQNHSPDLVVIYGDTNSTLAGALAAAKLHIPIAHVEAGLRSFDRSMPEEINRIVSDHASDLLLAPTETAIRNLANENLSDRAVLTGDVMLDAVLFNLELALKRSKILKKLDLRDGIYGVVTLHRAANTDGDRLGVLLDTLNEVAESSRRLVFPVHPRTRARIDGQYPNWKANERLLLVDPVGYLDMMMLLRNADFALTDSGGLQKEAFFLDTPCVTLREETEWQETVEADGNVLVGSDRQKTLSAVEDILTRSAEPAKPGLAKRFFGDGNAAAKIVESIASIVD
jgi:UDP-N-acetylglucosamine 2-epimerase (non-hydrolysing)